MVSFCFSFESLSACCIFNASSFTNASSTHSTRLDSTIDRLVLQLVLLINFFYSCWLAGWLVGTTEPRRFVVVKRTRTKKVVETRDHKGMETSKLQTAADHMKQKVQIRGSTHFSTHTRPMHHSWRPKTCRRDQSIVVDATTALANNAHVKLRAAISKQQDMINLFLKHENNIVSWSQFQIDLSFQSNRIISSSDGTIYAIAQCFVPRHSQPASNWALERENQ